MLNFLMVGAGVAMIRGANTDTERMVASSLFAIGLSRAITQAAGAES